MLGRRSFSTTVAVLKKGGPPKNNKDPLDISQMGSEFDFPLTRPTILKQELRRDFLHYLRLEQKQFGELVAFRKKFLRPDATQVIRVRHQHYQGEEHPAARKVVVSFKVDSLPLSSESSKHKFKLLAGPRWDSEKNEVKIGCELFPTDRMNEKWCSDVLDKMLAEAENKADDMADIPLDTRPTLSRLRKSGKKRLVTLRDFPSEWLAPKAPVQA